MGTSSSNPGSNSKSPIIPPHADAEPEKPLPKPVPNRFRQFRTHLGHYVKSGNKSDLNKSFNYYVSQATGGATAGPRRFGTAITVGGDLLSVLSALQSGETTKQITDENLTEAIGKPIDVAIEILADRLSPDGEDSDKIREALVYALSECLEDLDEEKFDPEIFDEEFYIETLICFLSEIVFQDILLESGSAFEKISSPQTIEKRENEIREAIKASVDKHLANHIKNSIANVSQKDLKKIQLAALRDVFAEWEGLEG